jgi:hypothetical protein
MKNVLPFLALVFVLSSCKVSEVISVDTLANSELLKEYQTFKMIDENYSDKRNKQIKLSFRDKLIEFGFEESSKNPDFLIQGVIVSREFIQELGHTSSIPGPFYSANNSGFNSGGGMSGSSSTFVVNRGMIGKVIFLIQDTKTNEIAWMGSSSGVVYGGGRQFDLDKVDLVLHQLLTSLY